MKEKKGFIFQTKADTLLLPVSIDGKPYDIITKYCRCQLTEFWEEYKKDCWNKSLKKGNPLPVFLSDTDKQRINNSYLELIICFPVRKEDGKSFNMRNISHTFNNLVFLLKKMSKLPYIHKVETMAIPKFESNIVEWDNQLKPFISNMIERRIICNLELWELKNEKGLKEDSNLYIK